MTKPWKEEAPVVFSMLSLVGRAVFAGITRVPLHFYTKLEVKDLGPVAIKLTAFRHSCDPDRFVLFAGIFCVLIGFA